MLNRIWNFLRNRFNYSVSEPEQSEGWSPWKASPDRLWANRRSPDLCDPVTCSECPGGINCCQAILEQEV